MMGNPTPTVVHVPGCLGSGYRQFPDHPEQRLLAFRQVCQLGRPVVHLRVDVDRVTAIPGRDRVFVPHPLQVQRLPAWARSADHQVTAELEQEGCQGGIGCLGELFEPFVGRHRLLFGRRNQFEIDSVEQGTVIFRMALFQCLIVIGKGFFQNTGCFGRRIDTFLARTLVETVEAGCHAEYEIDFIRVVHMDTGVGNLTFPVFREDRFQLGFEEHPFPVDLVTVKHPFVELAFAVCIVEFRVFVLVAPLFDLLECAPFHIAGSLSVKDQTVVSPFLQGCRMG